MSSNERRLTLAALASLALLACGARAKNPQTPDSASSAPAPAQGDPPHQAGKPNSAHSVLEPDGSVFLSAIPLQVSDAAKASVAASDGDAAFARSLRVRIEVMQGYKDLGELTRRAKTPLVNGTFQLSDLSHLGSHDAPRKRDTESSFVIDYDEKSFAAPAAELERSGKTDSAAAISSYAGQYIREKTYSHAFDIASRVAATRAGDCTEHAVFTTALLRRYGFKARVVLGIVLVGVSGHERAPQLLAFGHAWVERYEKGGWQIVDTALGHPAGGDASATGGLPADVTLRLAYLPINVIKDETAGFSRALMDVPGVESVLSLDVDVRSGK